MINYTEAAAAWIDRRSRVGSEGKEGQKRVHGVRQKEEHINYVADERKLRGRRMRFGDDDEGK